MTRDPEPMWQACADLFLGACCPGCGTPGWSLCAQCRSSWHLEPRQVRREILPTSCWAATDYAGIARRMIITYKDERVWRSAPVLADALTRAVAAVLLEHQSVPVLVVPIPSSPARVRERGLDTTKKLAQLCAQQLRVVGVAATARSALRQTRMIDDQAGLNASQRIANLAGGIRAHSPVKGMSIVLVDDVVTTGASLSAGLAALNVAGAHVLGAATIAARGWG